jgi:hypothetical protein
MALAPAGAWIVPMESGETKHPHSQAHNYVYLFTTPPYSSPPLAGLSGNVPSLNGAQDRLRERERDGRREERGRAPPPPSLTDDGYGDYGGYGGGEGYYSYGGYGGYGD